MDVGSTGKVLFWWRVPEVRMRAAPLDTRDEVLARPFNVVGAASWRLRFHPFFLPCIGDAEEGCRDGEAEATCP